MVQRSPSCSGSSHSCEKCHNRVLSIFKGLSHQQIKDLDACKTTQVYKKGDLIFSETDPSEGIYCVNQGKIKLYRTSDEGRNHILGVAAGGDVLGYRSLFSAEPHSMTAECVEETHVCYVKSSNFYSFLVRNPAMNREVLKRLSQEVESMEDKLIDLVDKPVSVRLARLLLMIKETFGNSSQEEDRLGLHLSRQEMADMIGTTQETVIRLLHQFQKEGILALEKREISLKNRDTLLKAAKITP